MTAVVHLPHSNPFATRRVRPGAIPFLFASGEDVQSLVDRFEANGRIAQIVGPHGSGKSTLLATLLPAMEARGYDVVHITLHAGDRRLPPPLPRSSSPSRPLIVVIDGYEQLSQIAARWLRWQCKWRGFGLLITTHEATTLPVLYRFENSLSIALRVFEKLFPPGDNRIAPCDVEALYDRHQGDMREMLFGLYELYEVRRRFVNS